MRIWIVNEYSNPPSKPGGARHHSLAREMARAGHEVTIFRSSYDHLSDCSYGDGKSTSIERHDGVRYLILKVGRYRRMVGRVLHMVRFGARVAWFRVGADQHPDIILGSTPHSFQAFGASSLARRIGVPFVLEVRDIWPLSISEMGLAKPSHPLLLVLGRLERKAAMSAVGLITLAPRTKEYLRAKFGISTNVIRIPNGVTDRRRESPPPPPHYPFVVVYAGALGVPNAIDILVSAIVELRKLGFGPNRIRFQFVGAGIAKGAQQMRVDDMRLGGVSFHDAIAKEEVPTMLQNASAFFLAVRRRDIYSYGTSSNKIPEYMAAARPIILSSDEPDEYLVESGCGIVVPAESPVAIAEAIVAIYRMTPDERYAMGMRARRIVEGALSVETRAAELTEAMARWLGEAQVRQ